MPIRGTVTPGQEQALSRESGAYRTHGPSRQIGETPKWLSNRVAEDITPVLQKVREAIASGKEISPVAQDVFNMLEGKIDRRGRGGLQPQDLASVWLLAQEAMGSSGGIGGLNDSGHYLSTPDASNRYPLSYRLSLLQEDIAVHLTQAHKEGLSGRLAGLESKLAIFDFLDVFRSNIRYEANQSFRMPMQFEEVKNELARNLYSKDSFNDLTNDEQKRKVLNQTIEQMWVRQGSNRAKELLSTVGTRQMGDMDTMLGDAREHGSAQEKFVVAQIENIKDTRGKILSQTEQVRKMASLDDLYAILGLNPKDPNQLKLLPQSSLVEAGIRYLELNASQADDLRKNPDLLVEHFKANVSGLTLFVGEFYKGELSRLALERSDKTPEALKGKAKGLNEKGKKSFDAKKAVYMLLLENGTNSFDKAKDVLVNKLGIDDNVAQGLITEATNSKILEDIGQGQLKISMTELVKWADDESLAYAVHMGYVGVDQVKTARDEALKQAFPANDKRAEKLAEQMTEFEKLTSAFDKNARTSAQIDSLKRFHPSYLALNILAGLPMIGAALAPMLDEKNQDEVAEYLTV